MATVTLTANTDVSALSLDDDDTIDLAGFVLTFDVQPTATGIQVTTPGTNGTCVFPVACVIPTWDFFAGTSVMIGTLPANCEIGGVTGGTAASAECVITNNGIISGNVFGNTADFTRGVRINNGTITGNITSSSGNRSFGVQDNNGTINGDLFGIAAAAVELNTGTILGSAFAGSGPGLISNSGTLTGNAVGGSVALSHGVATNIGEIGGVAVGGSVNAARGCQTNNGTIRGGVVGGSATTADGVQTNNGTIEGMVIGGTLAPGIATNSGAVIGGLQNAAGFAILNWRGSIVILNGPLTEVAIPSTITTIYSIGPLSELATIPEGVEVITLSEGTGTAGFTGIRALSRRLGT
jgi:hypothetical protein